MMEQNSLMAEQMKAMQAAIERSFATQQQQQQQQKPSHDVSEDIECDDVTSPPTKTENAGGGEEQHTSVDIENDAGDIDDDELMPDYGDDSHEEVGGILLNEGDAQSNKSNSPIVTKTAPPTNYQSALMGGVTNKKSPLAHAKKTPAKSS